MSSTTRATFLSGVIGVGAGAAVVWLILATPDTHSTPAASALTGSSAAAASAEATDIHEIRLLLANLLAAGTQHGPADAQSPPQALAPDALRDLTAAVHELASALSVPDARLRAKQGFGSESAFRPTDPRSRSPRRARCRTPTRGQTSCRNSSASRARTSTPARRAHQREVSELVLT